MRKSIKMHFDRRVSYGSKEHFFHFIWGYLLPSVYEIELKMATADYVYRFESCGPIMNAILIETLNLIGVEYHLSPDRQFVVDTDTMILPRWDIYLAWDLILSGKETEYPLIKEFRRASHIMTALRIGSKSKFKTQINSVRRFLLTKIMDSSGKQVIAQPQTTRRFLILQRSPEPTFYSKDGDAEIKTYGTSRRFLADMEEALERLHLQGINAQLYEPGKNALIHQIHTFNACAGVVAIRGAELANIIWLDRGSKVLAISPGKLSNPPIPRELASLLDLDYIELLSEETKCPSLLDFDLVTYLR